MSIQTIGDKVGYVVEFDEVPELPITYSDDKPEEEPYAMALAAAISKGWLTKPGKYMIVITDEGKNYEIFTIKEGEETHEDASG